MILFQTTENQNIARSLYFLPSTTYQLFNVKLSPEKINYSCMIFSEIFFWETP
jgi:hypothetical protein